MNRIEFKWAGFSQVLFGKNSAPLRSVSRTRVKHLRWNFQQKQLTTENRKLFLSKAPSQMFGRVLNTPLTLEGSTSMLLLVRRETPPVKRLKWGIQQKQLTAENRKLFLSKAPSQMFGRVLNTLLPLESSTPMLSRPIFCLFCGANMFVHFQTKC